jgi:relaxase-like protein
MIGKISARGARVAGLVYYLYGPGRNEAHTDPHLVAGWRHPTELEPPLRDDGRRDFRHLTGLLQQPHVALGPRGFERPVWHCSVRAAPGDRMLSDHEWAQVARDIMHRTGLAPHGQDDDAVRWIAVRHAPDHIHVVAMLARQDGTRPSFWNDRYRAGEACRAAEERFGLRRTAPRDRTGAPRPTQAESEKARRHGRSEPPRITLRRAVSTAAATAASEREFFARLDAAGISVRRRYSTRDAGEITGYAVALPTDTTRTGGPVWYSGGKLASDLTLPKLRHRWAASGGTPRDQFTAAERDAIWEYATRAASRATAEIRHLAGTDPWGAADAAWAAADTLHAAASVLGSREMRRAADSYARAASTPTSRNGCATHSSKRSRPVGTTRCGPAPRSAATPPSPCSTRCWHPTAAAKRTPAPRTAPSGN